MRHNNDESTLNLDHVLEIAETAARAAGAVLMDGYHREKEIQTKSSAVDFVTQYDLAAETLIMERLRAAFPDHGFVGEEGTAETGSQPYIWYIDPLDGTSNYSHGFPVFCVSLALYEGERPLLGVIYDPTRDECFAAIDGRGARLASPTGVETLHVSAAPELVDSLLATGFPYDVHTSPLDNAAYVARFIKRAFGLRRAGSAALDMAYVAAGRLDGYWEFKVKAWDVAAGILLVREAGGAVTLIDGRPLGFAPQLHILASNGHIHDHMLAVIRRTEAEELAAIGTDRPTE
jgi:myo-inositol-1(or 4)-monophosphatase